MIQQAFSGILTLMLAKFVLNDMPHAMLSNPGTPEMTSEIISRTGMKWYEYRWFPEPEEERPGRVYPYTRVKDIGTYRLRMTRTDSACTIRLYEFLEGWKKKLRATWTGFDKPECDAKFNKIVDVVKQVRTEYIIKQKEALRRK